MVILDEVSRVTIFRILIYYCFSKFFFIDKLNFLSGWWGLGSCVTSLDKLFLCKPNICTGENKERHPQDYFHTDIGQQKCLFKELNSTQLILEQEACYSHPISYQSWAGNRLYANVGILYDQT